MGGIKPIGSEKLEGMDKIRRIIDIARYNENIPQAVNETSSTEYSILLADGNTYMIEKERQGYIIKVAINESDNDYIESMRSRKYFSSYSQALKRLNFMTKEINVLHKNEEGTSLIGEQKKKFILKTKKTPKNEPVDKTIPSPDGSLSPTTPPPPPADMGSPEEGLPPPPADMESPEDGFEETEPEMDDEDEGETGDEIEKKPKNKKVSDLKRIQILVGKLAQKIRTYEEDKELSPKEIKYIINSILSAIDVEVLDEDDIEQIIDKLEGTEEKDDSEDEDVPFDETEVEPEPPIEPEMSEDFDTYGDAFANYFGGAFAGQGSKVLRQEEESNDEYHKERRKNYRSQYTDKGHLQHGTFNESSVDKVLSRYIILNEEENRQHKLNQEKKTNLSYRVNKKNIIKLSESANQLDTALEYIRVNPRVKLIGISNKGNLIFKEGINEVKITKLGRLI